MSGRPPAAHTGPARSDLVRLPLELVEVEELPDSERGAGGLGSSGM